LAPNLLMSKSRAAKVGARTLRAMSAARCHASIEADGAERASVDGSAAMAPAARMNARRFDRMSEGLR
jgi:hypothetical protein